MNSFNEEVIRQELNAELRELQSRLKRVGLIGMIAFFAIGFPVTVIHELGHGFVCTQTEGFSFEFSVSPFGGIGYCIGEGVLENQMLFLALGGGLGTLAAAIPMVVLIPFRTKKYVMGIILGLATITVAQFSNMMLETFAYGFYIEGLASVVLMQGIVLASYFAVFIVYSIIASAPYKAMVRQAKAERAVRQGAAQ